MSTHDYVEACARVPTGVSRALVSSVWNIIVQLGLYLPKEPEISSYF